jgi:hypothetical protein
VTIAQIGNVNRWQYLGLICACWAMPVVAAPTVVEYFNRDLDDYFITADPSEQAFVDSGAVGRWQRTGITFAAGGATQVCRFYGNGNIDPATKTIYGPNSHFYTADANECAGLKAQYAPTARSWKFESNDFLTTPAVSGICPSMLAPIYCAYNNGFARGIDSNHRITSNFVAYQQTVAGGWIGEGIVMCAPPGSATSPTLLLSRDGMTVYDTANNISWLADANLAASNTLGLPYCRDPTSPAVCVAQDGSMTWDSANQFIANMNAGAGYLGQKNWQLPPGDQSCTGYNCVSSGSPMASLFYGQLGLSQGTPVVAAPNVDVGPFNNIQPYLYWACEGAAVQDACQTAGPAPNFEWSFSFGNGFEGTDILANDLYVTAYFVGPPAQ